MHQYADSMKPATVRSRMRLCHSVLVLGIAFVASLPMIRVIERLVPRAAMDCAYAHLQQLYRAVGLSGGSFTWNWALATLNLLMAMPLAVLTLVLTRLLIQGPAKGPCIQCRELPRCKDCGYLLIGLEVRRCPECGRPFDPCCSRKVNPGT